MDEYAQITENGMKNIPVTNHRFLALKKWNTRAPILSSEEMEMLGGTE